MTKFYLLRHGQTLWNRERRIQGRADVALSQSGRDQAEELAKLFANRQLSAIVSSPLVRARETAEIIARSAGVEVIIDDRLSEIDVGSWEGLTIPEVTRQMPDFFDKLDAGEDFKRSATGETAEDLGKRGAEVFVELARKYHQGNILAVTHGFFIQVVISTLLGFPGHGSALAVPRNAMFAVLDFGNRWRLDGYGITASADEGLAAHGEAEDERVGKTTPGRNRR